MLTCEICGEELMLEEDMKTHLLLSHLENKMCCPLCSLSGVSYDELSFHISAAHPENHSGLQDSDCDAPACSSPTFTGTKTDMSESATSHSARESRGTPGGGKRHSMAPLTTDMVQSKRNSALIPPSTGTTPVRGGSSPGGAVPTVSSSSTTRSPTSRQMSVRPRAATAAVDDDGEDADGVISEHNKVKQNCLSSPRKGESG